MSSLAAAAARASSLLGITPAQTPTEIDLSIDKNVFEYNGNWYVIYKKCDNMNNKFLEQKSPLLQLDGTVNNLGPGVYTWMITTDKSNVPHLYVKKTLFMQEIQTKHSNIVYDLQKAGTLGNIYYAGELQTTQEPKKLRFNYLSGSYMLGRVFTEEQETVVIEFFKSKFPDYEVTYDKIIPGEEKTYITADAFKMDEERFRLLKLACPGNVYMFNNKEEAIKFSRFEFDNATFAMQITAKENLKKNKFYQTPELQSKLEAEIAELKTKIRTFESFDVNKVRTGGGMKKRTTKQRTHKNQKRLRKQTQTSKQRK